MHPYLEALWPGFTYQGRLLSFIYRQSSSTSYPVSLISLSPSLPLFYIRSLWLRHPTLLTMVIPIILSSSILRRRTSRRVVFLLWGSISLTVVVVVVAGCGLGGNGCRLDLGASTATSGTAQDEGKEDETDED